MMNTVMQITLEDGLMFPSGLTAPASYSCIIFCRVSPGWLEGDQVTLAKLEPVFENLYGEHWRAGNDDGSRYVVRSVEARILTPAEEHTAPWLGLSNDGEYHYWFYHVTATGELQKVDSSGF
ncbi:MAG TPA: hypothetical protein VGO91_19745 [Pyrinomonadaceae bacterium]|nr:hypothetical protein [Pyrinomonadaceae bacterium]